MQVKELKSSGLTHSYEVNIPANDIAQMVDEELLNIGQTVKIAGFRPGKVPLAVLKQKYSRHVLADVLEKAVNKGSSKVITDKGLRPAMQPKIEVKSFDEGKDLTFTMDVDVLPEIKLMDMKKIEVENPIAKVDAKAVNEVLDNIASNNRNFKPIEAKRAAKKGDVVLIDFHGVREDGVEFDGMHGHDHNLELGSNQFIPGFEDQLIGTKAGDHVHVNVTFPENYGMKDLAGRGATFHVDVKAIQEAAKTEVNDDLAKKMGLESLDALKDAIKEQISSDYAQYSRMKLKKNLLDVLDVNHKFDLPEGMVKQEHEHIVAQLEREEGKEAGTMSDKEKKELLPLAERRVRLGIVLAEIGRDRKVEVTQAELQQAVISEARKYPGQEKMVFEYYQKNPQVLDSLRAPIYEDKVIDAILADAKVTEKSVSVDDLMKEDDEIPGAEKKEAAPKKAAAKKKA